LFDEALVNLEELLLLALALALGLSAWSSNEIFFVILGNGFGVCPFLVLLTLIWLAGLGDTGAECKLLLSLLSEVVSVGDIVVFWLGLSGGLSSLTISWCGVTITSQSLLFVGLGKSFTGFLVVELSLAFIGAPAVSDLFLGFTKNVRKDLHHVWHEFSPSARSTMSVKLTGSTTASPRIGSLSTIAPWGSVLSSAIIGGLSSVVGAASIAITESWSAWNVSRRIN
jgi:hypothetical protein